jgi:hypothetical protein
MASKVSTGAPAQAAESLYKPYPEPYAAEFTSSGERVGGVGGINLSVGQTILDRVVELQNRTKKELQADLEGFLGGRGLPVTGGAVLPRGGGIQVKGATLPPTENGEATIYGGSIQTAVKIHNGRDPTHRPYDQPAATVPGVQ